MVKVYKIYLGKHYFIIFYEDDSIIGNIVLL